MILFLAELGDLSVLQNILISSGACPASYSVDVRESSPGGGLTIESGLQPNISRVLSFFHFILTDIQMLV